MRLQKWLVRGWVFTMLGAIAGVIVVYEQWTDPLAVRQQVISQLEDKFPGADVTLEAARLRILGGILLTDLRLFRRDDSSRVDVAYIPSSVVYHDKEQILSGLLTFHKIELHRPRIRVIRERDGKWNFEDLAKTAESQSLLPTLVLHEGTVVFEDRQLAPDLPPLEITGVQLTMINDPISTVRIKGTGTSKTLGKISIEGTWERPRNKFDLKVQVQGTIVSPQLIQRFIKPGHTKQLDQLKIDGQLDVAMSLKFDPNAKVPLQYDIEGELADASVKHPLLPLACTDVHVSARCQDGEVLVRELNAKSGTTLLSGSGRTSLPNPMETFKGTLRAEHLLICPSLCQRFNKDVQELHGMFHPSGPITMQFHAEKKEGSWLTKRCVLEPENIQAKFAHFPYPVKNINGTIDADLLKQDVFVDLVAKSGSEEIRVRGKWKGSGEDIEVNFKLTANQIPLDDRLVEALPTKLPELARSFHPTGYANMTSTILRNRGDSAYSNEYHVDIYDASVKWDQFPYLLTNMTGRLEISPTDWRFENFQGEHKGGRIKISGSSLPVEKYLPRSTPNCLIISIAGEGIGIDDDLRKALKPFPGLATAWDIVRPSGNLSFHTNVVHIPGEEQQLDISLDVHGCSIEPTFYRYRLNDLSGKFRYHGNRLEMKNITARHGLTRVGVMKGTVDISEKGGFYADIGGVQGGPIYPTDGFAAALPKAVRETLSFLGLRKPLTLRTRVVIAKDELPGSLPDVYWDGQVWFRDDTLHLGLDVQDVTGTIACVGRHNGRKLLGVHGNILLNKATLLSQPFTNVHAKVTIPKETPDVMLLGLRAPVFGGEISGQARVDFHSTLRYELNLTGSQIDLQKFGRHNMGEKSEIEGKASARLHLTGTSSGVDSLGGNGTINIPHGKLLNLPLLLDLLKFLGLHWPDRTAFEEAQAKFSIHGKRLKINQLNLWGNAVSLSGKGELNLDGTDVKMNFCPSWARVEQVLPRALRNVPPAISSTLFQIDVRGEVSKDPNDLKFHKRPVPAIVDPLKQLRDQVDAVRPRPKFKLPQVTWPRLPNVRGASSRVWGYDPKR
ncbi:MAG: AsmA-like C-terminal region-containing protein [Gemmataceae bacterium]